MKKIGLIGGMSWESSQVYYKIINEKVREIRGGFHSCKSVMESVDFAEIEALQHKNDWDALSKLMIEAAQNLERAGAEVVLICTNTMHLCADDIVQNTSIPLLHIADATGRAIQEGQVDSVLLLGTKFTMESDFYKNILLKDFGITTTIPDETDRLIVHNIIYEELVQGIISKTSKEKYLAIIDKWISKGVKGVILGCTEIPLLIQSKDLSIPVYDTTRIHSEAAVAYALSE